MAHELHKHSSIFSPLYHLSDNHIFILLALLLISVSIIAVAIINKTISLNLRYKDNPVIGNMSGFVSIIYGVLAGLTALYLINNINYTEDAVQREANAVANIYRDSLWLKNPLRENIHANIRRYLEDVIDVEWPLMRNGQALKEDNENVIDNISAQLNTYPIITRSELLIVRELLNDVKTLYDSRQQRIHMTFAALNPQIWVVIWIGTILTLAMNFLFGMNFYLHIITTGAAALMATSIIYLLITLDKPFEGEFIVEPDAFIYILKHMDTLDLNLKKPLPSKTKQNTTIPIADEVAIE